MKATRLGIILFMLIISGIGVEAQDKIYRTSFSNGENYLRIEILDDDLAHFELSGSESVSDSIETSPMIAKHDYQGASSLKLLSKIVFTTAEMRLEVDEVSLCVSIFDLTHEPELHLTTSCPTRNEQSLNGLSFSQEGTTDVYGLGEQFRRRGGTDGNWMGNRRTSTSSYGNTLSPFNGGNVANAQFPIMYALGEGTDNYAVFVDHVYQQYWTFTDDPFLMQSTNPPFRWYVMTGKNLQDLRSDYMELTGKAPVPPRQMFGLWVSEYGYDNWQELNSVLSSMLEANFPLDGFVLDLQWFGNIGNNSQMGSLSWDIFKFPNPEAFIANLRDKYGIGIMTIEEPYLANTAKGAEEAVEAGVLVRSCESCEPVSMNEWWGEGGMVDWTNPDAAAWWHDHRRQHLIDEGVMAHWTDLGEPENYVESAWYFGGENTHASIHNLYNFFWSQSIYEAYRRNKIEQRPFILSRSGTSGSQRYAVAMWSGDIAANMPSLQEQMNVQMQMSLSGVDYFGSDIGGFYRQSFDPVLGEDGIYTVWLANSVLTDIPLRPHAFNVQNQYETAPSLIGDLDSNLANVRLRYELSPYLYTLAHRAYRTGEAIFPPLVYYFQDDLAVRKIGSQKMIGEQMMMATITGYELETTHVYLPVGGWFNYHTGIYSESIGQSEPVPTTLEGLLLAPLFVRDGAIIPTIPVSDKTGNMLGQERDNSFNNALVYNIYHANQDGNFTLIEDDGKTIAYQSGAVRETMIKHYEEDNAIIVEIAAAEGTFTNAPDERDTAIRLFSPDIEIQTVELNGETLPQMPSPDGGYGWIQLTSNLILVNVGQNPVDTALVFRFNR